MLNSRLASRVSGLELGKAEKTRNAGPQTQNGALARLHSHYIVPGVDVKHLAGNRAAPMAAKIERGFADLLCIDVAL
jgi:hypothetical protein